MKFDLNYNIHTNRLPFDWIIIFVLFLIRVWESVFGQNFESFVFRTDFYGVFVLLYCILCFFNYYLMCISIGFLFWICINWLYVCVYSFSILSQSLSLSLSPSTTKMFIKLNVFLTILMTKISFDLCFYV